MKLRRQNPLSLAARSSNLLGLCTITFCALAAGPTAQADIAIWDGAAGSPWNWNADNWSGGLGVGGAPVANDSLTFVGNFVNPTSNNFDPGTSFAGINFTNDGSVGKTLGFTLAGNSITLGGNIVASAPTVSSTIANTISLDLVLSASRTITINGSTFGRQSITINGIISDGGSGYGLTKGGSGSAGALTLGGNNTFSGNLVIENGDLNVTKIADSGATNIGYGSILQLGNNANGGQMVYTGTGDTTGRQIQIGSGGSGTVGGASISSNGANGGTGLKFTNANFNPTNLTVLTTASTRGLTLVGGNTDANEISGIIAEGTSNLTTSLTKNNGGRWIVSNTANTFTGSTHVQNGVLEVKLLADFGAASSLGAPLLAQSVIGLGNFGNGGTLLYTGATNSETNRQVFIGNSTANTGNGGGSILSSGVGTLAFTNPVFNTPVATGAGTDAVNTTRLITFGGSNTGDNRIAGVIANNTGTETPIVSVVKQGSGRWILQSANTYTGNTSVHSGVLEIKSGVSALTQNLAGAITMPIGEGTLVSNKSGDGSLSTTFGSFSRSTGASANFVSTGGTNGTDNSVNITGGVQGFIDKGTFFNGADFAARSATNGFVRALAYGGTDPNTAALNAVTASNHVKLTSSHSGAAVTLLSLNLSGGGVGWTTASGKLTVPGIIKSGGGAAALISGGDVGGSGTETVIRTDTVDDLLSISSNLTQAAGGLVKSGAGTLTLSGTNTYTGQTHVNAGTLSIGANVHLGAQATGAQLNLKGGTLQATGTFGLFNGTAGTNNRAVSLTNQSGIEVTGSNTLTIAGVVSNNTSSGATAPGFDKTGTGTLLLSGLNTYSGPTNVNAGKLVVTNSIANSEVSVTNSGTILASGTTATLGRSLAVNNGAILAIGDAANAATATATVTGNSTFNNGSIFSWDINAAGTSYDKLVTASVLGQASPAGDAVFRIVVADTTFTTAFWATNQTWADIFTTNGSAAISNWATIFGNAVSVVDSTFVGFTPSAGTFSITGSSLNWTAVPEPTSALAGLLITAGLLRRRRR